MSVLPQLGDKDPAQSGFWSVRESFVSFVLTNLPFIYPLIRGFIEKTRASTNKSGDRSRSKLATSGRNGYRLDSLPGQRPRHPDADSKEHIVSQYDVKPTVIESRRRVSLDEVSSQDSFTIVQQPQNQLRPVQGMNGASVSSQVSSARATPSENEPAQGIMVTRAYEWTVAERQ